MHGVTVCCPVKLILPKNYDDDGREAIIWHSCFVQTFNLLFSEVLCMGIGGVELLFIYTSVVHSQSDRACKEGDVRDLLIDLQ